MLESRLSEEDKVKLNELWDEHSDTITITAATAKKTWCSSYEFPDLIQEGFFCLMRAGGFTHKPGYNPERKGASSFKTYLVTVLSNHYRDMGTHHKKESGKISFVGEFVEHLELPKSFSVGEGDAHFYEALWGLLSPVARVILDVKWCSYPQRVPLTQIGRLLSIPYDKVLKANAEVKELAVELEAKGEKSCDCFSISPNFSTLECKACVDFKLCSQLFVSQKGEPIMADPEQTQAAPPPPPPEQAVPAPPEAAAPPPPEAAAPPPPQTEEVKTKEPRNTQTNVAFGRLLQGPASRKDLVAAVATVHPGTKGARVGMLVGALKRRSLVVDVEPVPEEVDDGQGGKKTVKTKRMALADNAIATLTESGELKSVEVEGVPQHHLTLKLG